MCWTDVIFFRGSDGFQSGRWSEQSEAQKSLIGQPMVIKESRLREAENHRISDGKPGRQGLCPALRTKDPLGNVDLSFCTQLLQPGGEQQKKHFRAANSIRKHSSSASLSGSRTGLSSHTHGEVQALSLSDAVTVLRTEGPTGKPSFTSPTEDESGVLAAGLLFLLYCTLNSCQ